MVKKNKNKYNLDMEFHDLLPEALKLCIENKQVSISMLQRKFSIGFANAARLIDQMESARFISRLDNPPCKVLITMKDFKKIFEDNEGKIKKVSEISNCNKTISCNDSLEKKDDKGNGIKGLTREEINKKLEILRETRNEENSYKCLRPAMAMCYCMEPIRKRKHYKITLICSECEEKKRLKTITIDENELGKLLSYYDEKVIINIEYLINCSFDNYRTWAKLQKLFEKMGEKNYGKQSQKEDISIDKYNEEKDKTIKEEKENLRKIIEEAKSKSIIEGFKSVGLDAELKYYCEDCDWKREGYFIVCVKARDENEWHESVPQLFSYRDNSTNECEYEMVLNFLKHKDNLTDKLNYKDIYSGGREGSGLIKTKVDVALQKVLGVEIYYTKKEIANNIKVAFEISNLKSKIDLALKILKLKSSNHDGNMWKTEYEKYLKEEKGPYLKTQQEFYEDYIASEDYKLRLDEYVKFMEGLHIIFDADFSEDGVRIKW